MRRIAFLLSFTLLLAACAEAADPVTTTTAPDTTTTTTYSYYGTYNTLRATQLWEEALLKTAPVHPIAHVLNATHPIVQVIYLNNYSPTMQQSVNLHIATALLGFPVELVKKIAPLRIYVQNSAKACLSRHGHVAGCTGGGHSMLLVITRNLPNGHSFQETLIHEIGHLLDWHEQLRDDFAPIRKEHGKCSAPGTHAQSSLSEDIAASFTVYAVAPDVLKAYSKDRYTFFHERYGDLSWTRQDLPDEIREQMLRRLEIQEWNCQR